MKAIELVCRLCADERLSSSTVPGEDTRAAAYRAWCVIVGELKLGSVALPMSPAEVQRARQVIRSLGDALDAAEAFSPSHVELVAGGLER